MAAWSHTHITHSHIQHILQRAHMVRHTLHTPHIHVYHRTYAAGDGAVRPVSSRQPATVENRSPGDNPETIRKSSDFLRDITRSARGWDFGLKPRQRGAAATLQIANQERKVKVKKKEREFSMRKETHLQVKQPVRTFGWPFRVIMPGFALLWSGLYRPACACSSWQAGRLRR